MNRLLAEYRPTMDADVMHSWAADVVAAIKAMPVVTVSLCALRDEYRPSMPFDVLQMWAADVSRVGTEFLAACGFIRLAVDAVSVAPVHDDVLRRGIENATIFANLTGNHEWAVVRLALKTVQDNATGGPYAGMMTVDAVEAACDSARRLLADINPE